MQNSEEIITVPGNDNADDDTNNQDGNAITPIPEFDFGSETDKDEDAGDDA